MTHAGTGKTVIAAFDYRNFQKKHPGEACRLLFVAHREEILTQSRDTFQGVLRDLNFGELFVGNYVPENLDYLFISVQTMNSQKLYEKLNPDYYDFIIVDEFHHASAPTYSGKRGLISRIESFEEDTGKELTFANFISHYHMDAREIYGKFSFARLMVWAGVREDFNEPAEEVLTKAFSRIVAIDSRRWIEFLLEVLPRLMDVRFAELPAVQLRMMRMFYITVWQKYMADFDNEEALQNLMDLADSPVMLAELIDLLQYRYDQIDLVDEPMDIGFDCPLDVHCTYTARQILTAFDDEKVMSFREGVKWLPAKNTDVFFITLNKSDKDYSPTTMYNDYSINEILFHWQSQSTTSDNSPTGQRYIHHKERGSKVVICVREFKNDSAGAAPYSLLGLCDFVKYEGSRPMNITWKLERAIPAKYLRKTGKLVV